MVRPACPGQREMSGLSPIRDEHAVLQQFDQLFLGQPGFADEGADCAFGQFAVVGNSQAPARRLAQNDVATALMVHFVAEFSEYFDRVCA